MVIERSFVWSILQTEAHVYVAYESLDSHKIEVYKN